MAVLPGATNLPKATKGWRGQPAYADAAHRVHARVEDGIRAGKDTGIGKLPSHDMAMNKAWLTAALLAATLIAWLKLIALDGDLARAEPKTLRYKIFHAARLARGARRRTLKIAATWPWGQCDRHRLGPHRRPPRASLTRHDPRPGKREGTQGSVEAPVPARQPGRCHALALNQDQQSTPCGLPPNW